MPMPIPRIPQALARHQENLPLRPVKKETTDIVLSEVISLKAMCAKWWLEKVQWVIRRDIANSRLFSLQRYLFDLPREIRSRIIHNGLKAGGLIFFHGSIPAVNKSLVFLSSDIKVSETIYIVIPKPTRDGMCTSIDLEMLLRNGEGIQKAVVTLPFVFNAPVKKNLTEFCRTCQHITHMTIREANDDALALVTRHCRQLQELNLAGSAGITDEGVGRAIVNLKWNFGETPLKLIDVGQTSVTPDGVMQLVSRLSSVVSFGSVDVVEAIEAIVGMTEGQDFCTRIEETTLKCATVNRIQTLKKYCPKLTSIKVTFQEQSSATLNDLRLLKNLTKIELIVREPFLLTPANLQDLVWAIGSKLLSLKVSGDVYWEADLGSLVGQCPHLRVLALPAVTLPMKESLKVLVALDTPTLKYLTELEIDCMKGVGPKAWAKDFNLVRRGVVLALRRCLMLRRFVFRPTCLVDEDMMEVLAHNSLQKLEELELYNSTLGLDCARRVVDVCVNLHVMKGIRTWRGMTLHDILLLRKYVRGHRRVAELKIIP